MKSLLHNMREVAYPVHLLQALSEDLISMKLNLQEDENDGVVTNLE